MGVPVLLRAPTSEPDRYESALRDKSFYPFSLPVLETVLHVHKLKNIIAQEPADSHAISGVIVTSARAAEAWGRAVDELLEDRDHDLRGWHQDWSQIPFYTVGPSTASILASLSGSPASSTNTRSRLCPRDIRGVDSGNAERLARFILEDVASSASQSLLYLTGDKNRDTLPNIIHNEGHNNVTLREEQVYDTVGVNLDTFDHNVIHATTGIHTTEPWWIVFFAPSSAAHVLSVLPRHFQLPTTTNTWNSGVYRARIASIGPTTADALRNKHNLAVAVVSPEPNADALAEALAGVV
ncbi:tetrapyrrole biosynthesis, uroporphyrinogen III synthase [Amylostereum chailletii]|nr:tetrapyrrole biosynthesis, uroporphyrinogen III synthase [Amylostereum chailletii]